MRLILVVSMVLLLAGQGAGAQAASNPANPPPGTKPETRLAFVIGNETYAAGALPTAANDAGLIAQTLQAAGFEVVGARDLDAETLRQSYGDFLKRVTDAGPNTVAFIYLAGYGLQYGNDNYYVPIGATVSRGADIPIETVRVSDLTGPLASLELKARFVVLDAAYKPPFKIEGAAVAGFSLVDPAPGALVAYNTAPGTVAPVSKGNYGAYAQSLAAELRDGGLPPDEIFERLRLRVSQQTKGAEVPWDVSKLDQTFHFFDRAKNAPEPTTSAAQLVALTTKPLKELPPQQAFTAALARDTIGSYSDFTSVYPGDPLAKRARVLLAVRREALIWRKTIVVDRPAAYWSYLSRYPKGPHAADARLRLGELSAAAAPPADFQAIDDGVPPPPPDELPFVDARPIVYFADPIYDVPPPPPAPDYWLPPVPVEFLDLAPPPPPFGLFFLPVPAFVPLPLYVDPPSYVGYPAGNYFYGGGFGRGAFIGNTGVLNNIHQSIPGGGPRNFGAGAAGTAGGAAAPGGVALPAAAAQRTEALQRRGIATPAQLSTARAQPGGLNGAVNGSNALPAPRGSATPGRPADAARPNAVAPAVGNAVQNRAAQTPAVQSPAGRAATAARPIAPSGPQRAAERATPSRASAARAPRGQRSEARVQQRQRTVQQSRPRQVQRAARAPVQRAQRVQARQFQPQVARPQPSFGGGPRPGPAAAARPGLAPGPRPGPPAGAGRPGGGARPAAPRPAAGGRPGPHR